MAAKTCKTSKVAAGVVIIFNLITMICCTCFFAISLWMISSSSTLSEVIQKIGSPTMKALLPREILSVQLGVAIALLTTFFFFIAFMGLYGAITRSQFLLFMYSTLVFLLLLLECALMYYFSSNFVEKGIQRQDGQWTHALRLAFHCCEHNYTMPSPEVSKLPWSCCGVAAHPDNCSADNIFKADCQRTITNWLNRYQTTIYVSLAVLHIVLSSCSLLRRTCSASHSHS